MPIKNPTIQHIASQDNISASFFNPFDAHGLFLYPTEIEWAE